jgi:outer membrane protein OmpA-like peptidoglycan-associated protein
MMEEQPSIEIVIAGHTDDVGSDDYNLVLSKRRSKAVADYLANKGITNSRIRSVYFGEDYPVATNDTPEGRSKNRRVEFKISKM